MITAARVRELWDYNEFDGLLRWRTAPCGHRKRVGDIAGWVSKSRGYRKIRLDGQDIQQHRVAWLWIHGEWPSVQLDHINGNRTDNRLVNLREATSSQNKMNVPIKRNNSSGYKGVSWCRERRKWKAQIQINGKNRMLGRFESPEEAHHVYCNQAKRLFGEFARVE